MRRFSGFVMKSPGRIDYATESGNFQRLAGIVPPPRLLTESGRVLIADNLVHDTPAKPESR